ncbi:hypothetical protein ACEWH9_00120 [Vibrio diabolicus]|uniref:hypothetical protein n=1 Tax=Vibrio diabolicus TaxID=50719 RepID=UPI0035A84734
MHLYRLIRVTFIVFIIFISACANAAGNICAYDEFKDPINKFALSTFGSDIAATLIDGESNKAVIRGMSQIDIENCSFRVNISKITTEILPLSSVVSGVLLCSFGIWGLFANKSFGLLLGEKGASKKIFTAVFVVGGVLILLGSTGGGLANAQKLLMNQLARSVSSAQIVADEMMPPQKLSLPFYRTPPSTWLIEKTESDTINNYNTNAFSQIIDYSRCVLEEKGDDVTVDQIIKEIYTHKSAGRVIVKAGNSGSACELTVSTSIDSPMSDPKFAAVSDRLKIDSFIDLYEQNQLRTITALTYDLVRSAHSFNKAMYASVDYRPMYIRAESQNINIPENWKSLCPASTDYSSLVSRDNKKLIASEIVTMQRVAELCMSDHVTQILAYPSYTDVRENSVRQVCNGESIDKCLPKVCSSKTDGSNSNLFECGSAIYVSASAHLHKENLKRGWAFRPSQFLSDLSIASARQEPQTVLSGFRAESRNSLAVTASSSHSTKYRDLNNKLRFVISDTDGGLYSYIPAIPTDQSSESHDIIGMTRLTQCLETPNQLITDAEGQPKYMCEAPVVEIAKTGQTLIKLYSYLLAGKWSAEIVNKTSLSKKSASKHEVGLTGSKSSAKSHEVKNSSMMQGVKEYLTPVIGTAAIGAMEYMMTDKVSLDDSPYAMEDVNGFANASLSTAYLAGYILQGDGDRWVEPSQIIFLAGFVMAYIIPLSIMAMFYFATILWILLVTITVWLLNPLLAYIVTKQADEIAMQIKKIITHVALLIIAPPLFAMGFYRSLGLMETHLPIMLGSVNDLAELSVMTDSLVSSIVKCLVFAGIYFVFLTIFVYNIIQETPRGYQTVRRLVFEETSEDEFGSASRDALGQTRSAAEKLKSLK